PCEWRHGLGRPGGGRQHLGSRVGGHPGAERGAPSVTQSPDPRYQVTAGIWQTTPGVCILGVLGGGGGPVVYGCGGRGRRGRLFLVGGLHAWRGCLMKRSRAPAEDYRSWWRGAALARATDVSTPFAGERCAVLRAIPLDRDVAIRRDRGRGRWARSSRC